LKARNPLNTPLEKNLRFDRSVHLMSALQLAAPTTQTIRRAMNVGNFTLRVNTEAGGEAFLKVIAHKPTQILKVHMTKPQLVALGTLINGAVEWMNQQGK
jgi:hypothetical protein